MTKDKDKKKEPATKGGTKNKNRTPNYPTNWVWDAKTKSWNWQEEKEKEEKPPQESYEFDDYYVGYQYSPPVAGGGLFYKTRKCKHPGDKLFPLGGQKIYPAAASDTTVMHPKRAGVYLDSMWLGRGDIIGLRSHPRLFVKWPDRGIIPLESTRKVCAWMHKTLSMGWELELGCVGGHGRTGTLLACYTAFYYALHTDVDIRDVTSEYVTQYVRANHCKEAVESTPQEVLIEAFVEELTGNRPKRGKEPLAPLTPDKGTGGDGKEVVAQTDLKEVEEDIVQALVDPKTAD